MQARFAPAPVVTLFGMTETCGGISWSAPGDPYEKRMTTGGLPLRGVDVRIVDPETDEEMVAGERGEITVRSPGLFERYHNDPEKTARMRCAAAGSTPATSAGSTRTGGSRSSAGSRTCSRSAARTSRRSRSRRTSPTHPAVKIAQVVGVPDARSRRCPAAFVELADERDASEEELIDFCRGRIARFKVPRHVRFVTEWPMSATQDPEVPAAG